MFKLFAFVLSSVVGVAVAAAEPTPVVAIIIDDIGVQRDVGRRVLALDGPVAASILPHTPHAAELARLAHARGKEVLLHQPMEATHHNELLGPGALTLDLSEQQLRDRFYSNLASLPHVSGVNNHMGSALTGQTRSMVWFMRALRDHNRAHEALFFVDSRTTDQTVALDLANIAQVPHARRHVFLDNEPSRTHVRAQLDALKRTADQTGFALAIGHPTEPTLAVLERTLPKLAADGYRLVPVRELIRVRRLMRSEEKVSQEKRPAQNFQKKSPG